MSELVAPQYLSASSISTFHQCPLKYKFGRIDKLPEDPTEATLLGNFVHDVLEDLYNTAGPLRSLSTARELARRQWDEKWSSEISKWVPEEKLKQIRWNAWWCVENIWKLEKPEDVRPSGCETEVNVAISGVQIKGFIDRWSTSDDGFLTITDYKTGKTPKPQYRADKYQQLIIYALAVEEMDIGVVKNVELLFLKDGDRVAKEITQDDKNEVRNVLVETRKQIDDSCATGNFETRPSRLCDWCSFKPICPYWNKVK